MDAGLAKLAELHAGLGGAGRKIAVLGDMLELGAGSAELHEGLLSSLQRHQIQKVYVCGTLMKHLFDLLPETMRGAHTKDAAQLVPPVSSALQANDVVLIKGSRGSRMDIVRNALMAPAPRKLKESADAL
jgi:UDP-N-acetylmuramoyl-tripeptide--D-alanyl-D-alanine ligase